MPGIQTLTNESAEFKNLIVGVASSAGERERHIECKCQKNAIQS